MGCCSWRRWTAHGHLFLGIPKCKAMANANVLSCFQPELYLHCGNQARVLLFCASRCRCGIIEPLVIFPAARMCQMKLLLKLHFFDRRDFTFSWVSGSSSILPAPELSHTPPSPCHSSLTMKFFIIFVKVLSCSYSPITNCIDLNITKRKCGVQPQREYVAPLPEHKPLKAGLKGKCTEEKAVSGNSPAQLFSFRINRRGSK